MMIRHQGPGLGGLCSGPPCTDSLFSSSQNMEFTQEITRDSENQIGRAQRLVFALEILFPFSPFPVLSPHPLQLLYKREAKMVSPAEGPTIVSNSAPAHSEGFFLQQGGLLSVTPPRPRVAVPEVTLARSWDMFPPLSTSRLPVSAPSFSRTGQGAASYGGKLGAALYDRKVVKPQISEQVGRTLCAIS